MRHGLHFKLQKNLIYFYKKVLFSDCKDNLALKICNIVKIEKVHLAPSIIVNNDFLKVRKVDFNGNLSRAVTWSIRFFKTCLRHERNVNKCRTEKCMI